MVIVWVGLFAILGFILYRMGGSAGYDTKWRDIGIPVCLIPLTLILGLPINSWFWLSEILLFASLTTYWKKKGTDARWYNWAMVGLGVGLAGIPYSVSIGSCGGVWLRPPLLALLITLWSEFNDDVVLEEGGRGFLIIFSWALLDWCYRIG